MIKNRKTVLVAVDVSDLHMALIFGRVFSKNEVNFEIFFVQSGLKSSKNGEDLYRKYGNLATFVDADDYSIVHGCILLTISSVVES